MKTEFQKLTETYISLTVLRDMILDDPNQPIKNAEFLLRPLEEAEKEHLDKLKREKQVKKVTE